MANRYTQPQIDAYMAHLTKQGKYTPEQVAAYKAHLEENFGPKARGSSPDNPQRGDIYGDLKSRAKAGFADQAGLKELVGEGYRNPIRNKSGEVVVQDPQGTYVSDLNNLLPDNFTSVENALGSMHPLNWLASHAGEALPFAGQAAGGALGGLTGLPSGPGALAMEAAGATAGAGAGEVARQAIGKSMGVRKDYDPTEAGSQAGMAGIAQVGGRVANEIPGVAKTVDWLTTPVRAAIGAGTTLLTGGQVPVEAAMRAMSISRGQKMRSAEPLPVGQKMEEEVKRTLEGKGADVGRAMADLKQNQGTEYLPTNSALDILEQYARETAPNTAGTSKVPLGERQEAIRQMEGNLTTPRFSEEPLPDAYRSEPVYERTQTRPEVRYTPIDYELGLAGKRVVPGTEQTLSPAEYQNVLRGYQNLMPEASINDLATYLDFIKQQKASARYGNNALKNPISDATVNDYSRQAGKITEGFTKKSSSLKKANAAYEEARRQAEVLGPLDQPGSVESFTSNLFNKNKTAQQQAAQALAPETFNNELLDLAAKQSYQKSKEFLGVPISKAARLAIGGGAGYQAAMHGLSPEASVGVGAATWAATNPWLHYQLQTLGSQQLLPSAIYEGVPAGWGLLKSKLEEEKK